MSARGKFFNSLYRWHRWLGLFLAVHLFVLILSGTLLVFHDEWQRIGAKTAVSSSERDPNARLSLQSLLEMARAADPNGVPLAINFDDNDPEQLTIRMGQDGSTQFRGSARQHFDRYQGSQTEIVKPSGFWDFMLRLHREFLLGFYGKLYVGLIGVLLLLALFSGLYIYGPTSARLAFGFIRHGRASWTWSDIHKTIGAGSFAWLALIALTGTLLATSGQLLKLYQYTELKELKTLYPEAMTREPISLDVAESAVQQAKPNSEIVFITFPGTEFATGRHFIFVVNDREGWRKYLSEIVLVDGGTGEVVSERGLPWYLKAAILSEPLHFGNYGGLALKMIWTVFGLFGLILTLSGPYLWYVKRLKHPYKSGGPNKAPPRSHKYGPYFVPACLGLVILSGSLIAMTSNVWMDVFSCLLLTAALFLLITKLINGLSTSTKTVAAKDTP